MDRRRVILCISSIVLLVSVGTISLFTTGETTNYLEATQEPGATIRDLGSNPIQPGPEPPIPPGLEEWIRFGESLWLRYGRWAVILALLVVFLLAARIFLTGLLESTGAALGKSLHTNTFRLLGQLRSSSLRDEDSLRYLGDLRQFSSRWEFERLPLHPPLQIDLQNAFIPLLASTDNRELRFEEYLDPSDSEELSELVFDRTKDIRVSELIERYPSVLLVGPMGSGKTAFLQHLTATLVASIEERSQYPLRKQLHWQQLGQLFPLYIPLGALGTFLSVEVGTHEQDTANPQIMLDYLGHYYRHLDLPDGFFAEKLTSNPCILMLDGLDEVTSYEDRVFLVELINRFCQTHKPARTVVTSRLDPRQEVDIFLPGFHEAHIAPIRWRDIRTFVERICGSGGAIQVAENLDFNMEARFRDEKCQDLITSIQINPTLRRLANNPLLLTIMSHINLSGGVVSGQIAEIFDQFTLVLLGWDTYRLGRSTRSIAEKLSLDELSPRSRRLILERLAFEMQKNRTTQLPRHEAVAVLENSLSGHSRVLASASQKKSRAETFLSLAALRSHLLTEKSGQVFFVHRAFQEYLSARYIARLDVFDAFFQEKLADLWWSECFKFTVAHLSSDSPERAEKLLGQAFASPHKFGLDSDASIQLLASSLMTANVDALSSITQEVSGKLSRILERDEGSLSAHEALESAFALGVIGDQRNLEETVVVPAGDVILGSSSMEIEELKTRISQEVRGGLEIDEFNDSILIDSFLSWLEYELPQHTSYVDEFFIAKFPVTNGQYRAFVLDRGYKTRTLWSSDGWNWLQAVSAGIGNIVPISLRNLELNNPNQPVVGVSWYEAEAFCNWLTRVMRDDGRIKETSKIRLPFEAEWEKAARFQQKTGESSLWPGADVWSDTMGNTARGGLGRTSPVGVYSNGRSSIGAEDMAGNVWEWCQLQIGSVPEESAESQLIPPTSRDVSLHAVKGGAWSLAPIFARCAARRLYSATTRSDLIGFRYVVKN